MVETQKTCFIESCISHPRHWFGQEGAWVGKSRTTDSKITRNKYLFIAIVCDNFLFSQIQLQRIIIHRQVNVTRGKNGGRFPQNETYQKNVSTFFATRLHYFVATILTIFFYGTFISFGEIPHE